MATYADLMRVLAMLYGADEETLHGQVRGRVQNLQKMGIPLGLGSQTGRGKKNQLRAGRHLSNRVRLGAGRTWVAAASCGKHSQVAMA